MLIDFCHHSVHPKIKTDKVSFDGYEVQNLISGNSEEKKKGFLSDHFIKPPVSVTVQFPCNVSIYRIVIDPVIGQQKSCDLKIFTACEKMTDSWLYNKSDNATVKTDGVVFNYVGSVTMDEPTVVCFVNNQFKERNLWRTENVPDLNRYPCVTQLNARKQGGLCNASHVTICINRSKQGKSVALRRLEIWGIPSVRVPNPVQITLKNTYLGAFKQREVNLKAVPKAASSSVSSCAGIAARDTTSENNQVVIDDVPVPEDFIDQITFDIMAVPVVLPCGNVIDRSTLERYINSEASWGRQPSDPFTGVVFSQGAGPVTNTSLKARIDQFVLKHSDALRIPQTLGHSDAYKARKNQTVSSKLVTNPANTSDDLQHSVLDCKTSLLSREANDCLSTNSLASKTGLKTDVNQSKISKTNQNICFSERRKRKKTTIGECTQSELNFKKLKGAKELPYTCIDLTLNEERAISINTSQQELKVNDHNSDLSQSLDSALMSTLGSLPSYRKKSSEAVSKNVADKDTMCSKCKADLKESDVVKYKMPCGHLICRSCLVQEIASFKCNICSSQCLSSQTMRVF